MPTIATRAPSAPKPAAGRAAGPPGRRRPGPAEPLDRRDGSGGRGDEIDLDTLAAQWWVAIEAGNAALRVAGRSLPGGEAAVHSRHLSEERAEAVRLLSGLEHDFHQPSHLVPWLAAPALTTRMLGLPPEVVACVFDLDGVLTASAAVHDAAWAETFDTFLLEQAERHHRPYIPFDRQRDYRALIAGKPRRDGVRAFLASRGISLPEGSPDDLPGDPTVFGLANRKNLRLRQHLAHEGVAAFKGSHSYLEAARMVGVRRAVVSPSANTAAFLERAGLDRLVEVRVDGNTIEAEHLRPKPAPDMLLAACRFLDVDPEQVATFETTTAGIAAARGAGVRLTIAVDRTGESETLHASDADRVVTDLAELLAAA